MRKTKTGLILAGVLLLFSGLNALRADNAKVNGFEEKPITWGDSHKFDIGHDSSITSLPGGKSVVQIHESEEDFNLWYSIGKVDDDKKTITWCDSHKFDSGDNPSITSLPDGKRVVEVHKSQNDSGLWYSIGKVDDDKKTITWGDSHKFDSGENPSITSLPSGTVVEVHQSDSDNLWYSIGTVNYDKKTITWGDSQKVDSLDDVCKPSITSLPDGTVVEVHQIIGYDNLGCSIGKVDDDKKTITWGDSHKFDGGQNPSITSLPGGTVVQIHESENDFNLWYSIGTVNVKEKNITWGDSNYIEGGRFPSITSLSDGRVVQIHRGEVSEFLNYRVGSVCPVLQF